MTQREINDYLDLLPEGSSFPVSEAQIEPIKRYMRGRDWDGGLHFSVDWKKIYKTSVPDEMPVEKIE